MGGFFGDDFMECPVEDVRHRMVALDGIAAGLVDRNLDGGAAFGRIVPGQEVQPGLTGFLGVRHVPLPTA